MTDVKSLDAICAELDAAREAYQNAQMRNVANDHLRPAAERIQLSADYARISSRYQRAQIAYDTAVYRMAALPLDKEGA